MKAILGAVVIFSWFLPGILIYNILALNGADSFTKVWLTGWGGLIFGIWMCYLSCTWHTKYFKKRKTPKGDEPIKVLLRSISSNLR